jgi:hypothetical protein
MSLSTILSRCAVCMGRRDIVKFWMDCTNTREELGESLITLIQIASGR